MPTERNKPGSSGGRAKPLSPAQLARANRKPGPSPARRAVTLCLALGLVILTFLSLTGRLDGLIQSQPFYVSGTRPPTERPVSLDGPQVRALTASELRQLEAQRKLVSDLARRHVGSVPRGDSLADLDVLQKLVDAKVLAPDQTYELQALGVALGDVMVSSLGLEWAVLEDRYGRSRALRRGDDPNMVYPVTIISKRVAADLPVDVRSLYAKVAALYPQ